MDKINLPTYAMDFGNQQSLFEFWNDLPSPYQDFNKFVRHSSKIFSVIPDDLFYEITRFKTEMEYPGALLIKNLPVDKFLCKTPLDGNRAEQKKTFLSEASLVGISQIFGDIFSYKEEKNGELIHNICPVFGKEKERSNAGSSEDFLFHTELAYFEERPDYLLLFCLRQNNAELAYTTLAFSAEVVKNMNSNDIELLKRPLYQIGAPQSFSSVSCTPIVTPALLGSTSSLEFRLNLNDMKSVCKEGEIALQNLKRALESDFFSLKVQLNQGDLLIIDNRKAVHGRTPFKAKLDGNDRWLQRVYVKNNLWSFRHLIKSCARVLEFV